MITSIVGYSNIEDRFDANYYSPNYVRTEKILAELSNIQKLSEFSSIQKARLSTRDNSRKTINYLDIANVDLLDGDVSLQTIQIKSSPCRARRKVEVGDICISTVRPIRNAVVLITEDLKDIICSTGFAVISPIKIKSEYLFAYLKTKYAIDQLVRRTSAAMYPAVSETDIQNIFIPIPGEEFQKQISILIKKSFELRNTSKLKYQEAKNILNKYLGIKEDKSNFTKTFSLKFTNIENRLDSEFYQSKALLDSPIFDKGTITLEQLSTIKMGNTPSKQSYTSTGVRILKVRDLTNKGINWDENNRAFTNYEVWDKSEKAKVKENDILLISAAHQAYYIGKELDIIYNIPAKYNRQLLAVAEILIIRPNQNINPYVLLWYLRSPIAYQFIQQFITGETSHLYPKDLVNLPVPKKLFDFSEAIKIERLTKESIILQNKSNELLENAKDKIENLILKGGEK